MPQRRASIPNDENGATSPALSGVTASTSLFAKQRAQMPELLFKWHWDFILPHFRLAGARRQRAAFRERFHVLDGARKAGGALRFVAVARGVVGQHRIVVEQRVVNL